MALTRQPTTERLEEWRKQAVLIGGRLSGVCRGRDLAYEIGTETRTVHSCCCGGEAKADIPYTVSGDDLTTFYARVCAVCDAATEFPRLQT